MYDVFLLLVMYTLVCRLLGSASIIILAFLRRRVFSAEVHPIFMLSFADCILDVMWIVGSGLWWAIRDKSNVACYSMTILTEVRAKNEEREEGERERERVCVCVCVCYASPQVCGVCDRVLH